MVHMKVYASMLKRLIIVALVVVGLIAGDQLLGYMYFNKGGVVFWTSGEDYVLDRDLIYSGATQKHSQNKSSEYTENVDTNSLGYRDHEIGKKDTKTYRIIAVGDSFTFGHGIESNSETYPKKLETYLNLSGKKVEVFNVAVRGYSPDQEYRQIVKKLLILQPDMIIWNFSDPGDLYNSTAHNGGWPTPSLYDVNGPRLIPLDARFNWVYMGKYVKKHVPPFIRNSNLLNLCIFYASQTHLFTRKPYFSEDALTRWAIQKLNLQVEDVKKITDKLKINLIITVLPYPYKFSPTSSNSKVDIAFNAFFKSLEKKRFTVIDVKNSIVNMKIPPKDLFYKIDYHPNKLGTAFFAKIVGEAILNTIR